MLDLALQDFIHDAVGAGGQLPGAGAAALTVQLVNNQLD
jgi:hypothetical protein